MKTKKKEMKKHLLHENEKKEAIFFQGFPGAYQSPFQDEASNYCQLFGDEKVHDAARYNPTQVSKIRILRYVLFTKLIANIYLFIISN